LMPCTADQKNQHEGMKKSRHLRSKGSKQKEKKRTLALVSLTKSLAKKETLGGGRNARDFSQRKEQMSTGRNPDKTEKASLRSIEGKLIKKSETNKPHFCTIPGRGNEIEKKRIVQGYRGDTGLAREEKKKREDSKKRRERP